VEQGSLMHRRDVMSWIGGAMAAGTLSFAACAQQATPVIGYLNGLSAADRPALTESFRKGLAEAGYTADRVTIEYRYGNYRIEQLRVHAADLVSRKVAVIVATGGNNPALVAKSATPTIPILFTSGVDPVKAGLVTSLSRPEANVTGVSWFGTEVSPKQMEVLREFLPQANVVGLFVNPNNPESIVSETNARQAAPSFGMRLIVLPAGSPEQIETSFATLIRERAEAAILTGDPYLTARAKQFNALAAQHRIPMVFANREGVDLGGLVSYGNNVPDAYRRVGLLTARILKGAKPGDVPIDRATKFELVANIKTARALGLTFPHSLLGRADDVID
jgi:putative tryptophan/tyrosine transport system substrate-binding protein